MQWFIKCVCVRVSVLFHIVFVFDQRCIKIKKRNQYYYCKRDEVVKKKTFYQQIIWYVMHIYYYILFNNRRRKNGISHVLMLAKEQNQECQVPIWKQVSMLINFINETLKNLRYLLRSLSLCISLSTSLRRTFRFE